MSQIRYHQELFTDEQKPACTFCGAEIEKVGGVWHAADGSFVFCCQRCAIEVLPKLIADSVWIRDHAMVPRILERFWYAVAARLSLEQTR